MTRQELAIKFTSDILRSYLNEDYVLPDEDEPDVIKTEADKLVIFAYALADAILDKARMK